jgi:hypothetical protein
VEAPAAPPPPTTTAASPATPASASPDGAGPADGKAGEVDVDQLAETVIDRLRRELLIEREQSGGAMDLM